MTQFTKEAFIGLPLTSLDFDGADFKSETHYQMIPLGASRTLQLFIFPSPAGRVRLGMGRSGIFEIKLPSTLGPFPPDRTFVELDATKETTIDLELVGKKAGRSDLIVEGVTGGFIDSVTISVKDVVDRTYNIHLLQDAITRTPRSLEELKTIMTMVETVYARQANLRLTRSKESLLVFPQFFFGFPLELYEEPTPAAVLLGKKQVQAVIEDKLTDGGFKAAHINVISTWTLKAEEGSETSGDTPNGVRNRTAYIAALNKPPAVEATVCAHEIGHTLGLAHNDHKTIQMMHEGATQSFLMNRFDIDAINTTDRKAP